MGAWSVPRNGDLGSGASRSGVGSSYRSVVGTVGLDVGFGGGVDPLRFTHDLTSDTLEMSESCLGYLAEVYCSVYMPQDALVIDVSVGA